MKYTEQKKLTRRERAQVEALIARCRDAEPLTVSFPFEEPDTRYFLAEADADGEQAVTSGALALGRLGQDEYAVVAFTDPAFRRQGIFKKLLESARRSIPSSGGTAPFFTFSADKESESAHAALSAAGAEQTGEELEMVLDLTGYTVPGSDSPEGESPKESAFRFLRTAPSGEGVIAYEAVPADTPEEEKPRPVFRVYLLPMKEKACFLHRIATRKDLIGTGVASEVFPEFLKLLKNSGYNTARLQVNGANTPAVKLYENAGFKETTRLCTYTLKF